MSIEVILDWVGTEEEAAALAPPIEGAGISTAAYLNVTVDTPGRLGIFALFPEEWFYDDRTPRTIPSETLIARLPEARRHIRKGRQAGADLLVGQALVAQGVVDKIQAATDELDSAVVEKGIEIIEAFVALHAKLELAGRTPCIWFM